MQRQTHVLPGEIGLPCQRSTFLIKRNSRIFNESGKVCFTFRDSNNGLYHVYDIVTKSFQTSFHTVDSVPHETGFIITNGPVETPNQVERPVIYFTNTRIVL